MRVAVVLLLFVACGGTEPPQCEVVLATIRGVAIGCMCPAACDRGCSAAICDRFNR